MAGAPDLGRAAGSTGRLRDGQGAAGRARGAVRRRTAPSRARGLVQKFWANRGVPEGPQRALLTDVAVEGVERRAAAAAGAGGGGGPAGPPLGSLDELQREELAEARAWAGLEGLRAADPAGVGVRLVDLDWALGGGAVDAVSEGVDTAAVAAREPELLGVPKALVVQRLLAMSCVCGNGEVLPLVEREPALLVQDLRVEPADDPADLLRAWRCGLASDRSDEWPERLDALQAYRTANEDCSVGCRPGDDPGLERWARKQRIDRASGNLDEERCGALDALGFQWDSEDAEWERWFTELRAFHAAHGHCTVASEAGPRWESEGSSASADFQQWVGFQRAAHKAGWLKEARRERLAELGFDFAVAPPAKKGRQSVRGGAHKRDAALVRKPESG